jgi:hypothetical protein
MLPFQIARMTMIISRRKGESRVRVLVMSSPAVAGRHL